VSAYGEALIAAMFTKVRNCTEEHRFKDAPLNGAKPLSPLKTGVPEEIEGRHDPSWRCRIAWIGSLSRVLEIIIEHEG
jgi:hypothetical protein